MDDLISPLGKEWFRALRSGEKVLSNGAYVVPQRVSRTINFESGEPYLIEHALSDAPPLLGAFRGAHSYTDVPHDPEYPPVTRLGDNFFSRRKAESNP
ncbi:MAG: hypothetical protein H6862_05055 [Rhodospirillales bacterium]|nr:hypothetical protein [Rhodospirillales bacterium]